MWKPVLIEPAKASYPGMPTGSHAVKLALGYWRLGSLGIFASGGLLRGYVHNETVAARREMIPGWLDARPRILRHGGEIHESAATGAGAAVNFSIPQFTCHDTNNPFLAASDPPVGSTPAPG